jgi:K+-transporting ATPase ATPase C chain
MDGENRVKNIIVPLRSAISLLLVSTILLGGIYPLIVTVIAQAFFTDKANGSLIKAVAPPFADVTQDKSFIATTIGSRLLGQEFTQNKYFWGRPSENNYDALNSGGTNLSPANSKLLERVNSRVEALQKADPENKAKIPVDLVTSSASGLDPHISLLAAEYQIERIAAARGLKPDEVQAVITDNIDGQSRFFGEPYVNVLEMNIALDKLGSNSNQP